MKQFQFDFMVTQLLVVLVYAVVSVVACGLARLIGG